MSWRSFIYYSRCYLAIIPLLVSTKIVQAEPVLIQPLGQKLEQSEANKSAKRLRKVTTGSKRLKASELYLDSADEIIMDSDERSNNFFENYKGLVYLKYFHEDIYEDFDDSYDYLESTGFAKNMLLYHGATKVSDYLEKSPLAESYKRFLKKIKSYKEMTTVNVSQSRTGSLDLSQGEKDEPILKFKLGVSTKRGVEPRLKVLDTITLRYDMFKDRALCEYHLDF